MSYAELLVWALGSEPWEGWEEFEPAAEPVLELVA